MTNTVEKFQGYWALVNIPFLKPFSQKTMLLSYAGQRKFGRRRRELPAHSSRYVVASRSQSPSRSRNRPRSKRLFQIRHCHHPSILQSKKRSLVLSSRAFEQITEKYPLSGEEVVQKRRDMRGGKHLGKAKWSSGSKEIQLDFRFEGEIAGTGRDTFKLISDEELHVVSTLETSDGKNTMTKIYKRKKKSDNATN